MIYIVLLFALFLVGVPICFSLGLVSLYGIVEGAYPLNVVIQRLFTGADSIALIAIPLFILAGGLMVQGGISRRIVDFADALIGHLPSGLALVSILACMFFAAITGSAIAATAAIGGIMIPIMEKKGYENTFSAPLMACGGSIGPIIPPSIPLLLYGTMANVSVGKLFIGGFIPGIIMGLGLMIYSYIVGKKRHYVGREKKATAKEIITTGKDAVLALIMPVIIIGGILSGIFTATEAGTVAIVYALALGLGYREMKLGDFVKGCKETVTTTSSIMLIVAAASCFSWVLTKEQIPQTFANWMTNTISNKYVFLLVVNIFLIIVGMFVEGNASMIVLGPLLHPVAIAFGIDPVHFAMVYIFNCTIGAFTPPMGTLMFVTCGITKCPTKDFIKEAMPFYLLFLVDIILLTYFPPLSTFLVDLIY